MTKQVFYSWQSDLDAQTNRNYIQDALKDAVEEINENKNETLLEVTDSDRKPGAKDINSTILEGIKKSEIFVADISIVARYKTANKDMKKATTNPNVMFELGYALGVLGDEKIILVFNDASGNVEDLPFDIRSRRNLSYNISDNGKFKEALVEEIKKILGTSPLKVDDVKNAIKDNDRKKVNLLEEYLKDLLYKIKGFAPKKNDKEKDQKDLFKEAYNKLDSLIKDFQNVVDACATRNDVGSAETLYKWFKNIYKLSISQPCWDEKKFTVHSVLTRCDFLDTDAIYDYYMVVGYEMFVIMMSIYLKNDCWVILNALLKDKPVFDWKKLQYPQYYIRDYDLRSHYSKTEPIFPVKEFKDMDFMLFLLAGIEDEFINWVPWSYWANGISNLPDFIDNSKDKEYEKKLVELFDVKDSYELKEKFWNNGDREKILNCHDFLYGYYKYFNKAINDIGTQN
jgi:hypothetical protein